MPDLINQLCRQFTAVAARLEQGWQQHFYNIQQELSNERQTNQELMHKIIGMEESGIQAQEKNSELVKELQETKVCWNNAEQIIKDASGVIDELRATLSREGGEAIAVHDGLSIRERSSKLSQTTTSLQKGGFRNYKRVMRSFISKLNQGMLRLKT